MTTPDWTVLTLYLAGTVFVGVFLGRFIKNSSDMFAAGGQSPWWISGLSAFMTMFSANTFVVWGGIAYEHGLVAIMINLCYGIAAIAYPWLASAVTRDPLLIALIAVAQRLPWLIFTLPAGVITDRVDRRKLIISMDVVRTAITVAVVMTVLGAVGDLPSPSDLAAGAVAGTNMTVYLVLLFASLAFGFAVHTNDTTS